MRRTDLRKIINSFLKGITEKQHMLKYCMLKFNTSVKNKTHTFPVLEIY